MSLPKCSELQTIFNHMLEKLSFIIAKHFGWTVIKFGRIILWFVIKPSFICPCTSSIWTVTNRAVVTIQPKWPKIYTRETITLTCEITNGGDTEWEYEWKTTSPIKPPNEKEYWISVYELHSGYYSCRGRNKNEQFSTKWSDDFQLTVHGCKSL